MQNWNQWQLSAGAVTTTMPQPPVGYATPGTDPMAMMQAYMQYYNQPAPSGYTPEQWAAAQQQNWVQWQQWQQQYQQWQAQYGEKYQETMKQMTAQNMGLASQAPPLPNVQAPPLPKEDTKPPLPPSTINMYQFTSMPPPNQNNLPLFPVKPLANNAPQASAQNCPPNPPLPVTQPPLPPENSSSSGSSSKDGVSNGKRDSSTVSEPSSAKKLKLDDEDLTEAEKTFDAQFKQWEEQFNKWKQQNANHPDKTQYKQYEAKWTSWREKLIERREQMRRKREQQKQAAAKAEAEKNKTLPGDDKILNILSNTENQGLINNLLGIGKTLGLTGKHGTTVAPPPPPPPPAQTTVSDVQSTTTLSQVSSQLPAPQSSAMNMMPPNVTSTQWNTQQWSSQYSAGSNLQNFSNFQSLSGVPPPPFGAPPSQMPPLNFSQPPPNFAGGTPNFSQPPPGFGANDTRQPQGQNVRPLIPNMQGRPPFGPNDPAGSDMNVLGPNDRSNNFDPVDQSNNFGRNEHNRQKDGPAGSDRFGRDGMNKNFSDQPGNQFRPGDAFAPRDDRMPENEQFRRDDRGYQDLGNNQFSSQKMNFNSGNERFQHGNDRFGQGNDRFGSAGDRFGPGNNRFGPGSDRYGSMNDRSASGNDRFGPGNDRFGPGNNRFGPGNDRFGPDDRYGPGSERLNQGSDRFSTNTDRFGPNNDQFGPGNERFNRNSLDRFDQKDGNDSRRDSFNPRGFNRNNHFEPPVGLAPELKKLMEKRRAAMDVFKPSFLESDKNSSVGSLSESFKRIAGDSPFGMKTSNDYSAAKGSGNFGPRGNFSPADPGNFRMPGTEFRVREPDFKPQGPPDFGPRGPPNFRGPMDNFGRDMPHASPQIMQDLVSSEAKSEVKIVGNEAGMDKNGLVGDGVQDPSIKKAELVEGVQTDLPKSVPSEQESDNAKREGISQEYPVQSDILLIEKPPWVDAQFPQESAKGEKDIDERGGNGPAGFGAFPDPNTQNTGSEQSCNLSSEDKKDTPSGNDDGIMTKSDVLPFMGENDPKPEDLNMEPPPELPNLGPVSSGGVMEPSDNIQRVDQPFDPKVPPLRGFQGAPEFGPRGAFDSPFGPRGMQFRPNAPPLFGPRGPNDGRFLGFEPRDAHMFPYNSPGPNPHQLGPRPPNDGQFGPRGPANEQFVPKAPGDGQFVSRMPNEQFGPQGPNNRQFGPSRPNDAPFDNRPPSDAQFNARGPTDGQFGFSGSNDKFFGTRRPNNTQSDQRPPAENMFGPRGPNDGHFPNRGLKDGPFAPRGFNEKQFDAQGPNEDFFARQGANDRYSGQRGPGGGPNDGGFTSRNRDGQFNNRSPYGNRGPGDFRQRGQFDKMNSSLDDLSEKHSDRNIESGGPENRADSGRDSERPMMLDSSNNMRVDQSMEQGQQYGPNEKQTPGWRQPFSKNSFGDTDQRSARDPGHTEKPPHIQGDALNQNPTSNVDQRAPFMTNRSGTIADLTRSEKSLTDSMSDLKPGYGDSSSSSDFAKFSSPNAFAKRSADNRPSQARCPVGKEFCIERQFNYNHGGASVEKKFNEHVPVKIIDYAHASRAPVQDRSLTPVQCFDYGHGNLKPVVPDRETQPKKDFRNWEENEQNLRDYTDRLRRYEYFAGRKDYRRPVDYRQRRDSDGSMDDRKYERERRDREDYKLRDRGDERMFDRMSDRDQENRYQNDRSYNKERTQERCETSQKEAVPENDKDEDRSKGNINWQDSTNKNITETKPKDNSIPDAQHVFEPPPKTVDMGKTSNCTMVDDLLCPPGRQNRPPKIAIILRGPPGSGKSFVAKLIKDKEVEQGGSAPRILSLDDYFLTEKEIESKDDNGKKVIVKDIVYEYEEAMEQSYVTSLVKAFKKNITDGFFNFIILDCINEKISDYEEMWSFAKTKGFKVYICEMEMDLQICLKRNIHNRTEEEINRIIDYFEPTPGYHQKLDVNSMLQEHAIEEVQMEDSEEVQEETSPLNEDSQDSQEDAQDTIGVSKWERMEADDKLDRLDGLAKKKNEGKVQTMKDFLQVPDYYNMEDTSGKKRVRWADLEERKEQEKMRAVGFVVGHTNWDRMMDPTKGGSALTRTKYI